MYANIDEARDKPGRIPIHTHHPKGLLAFHRRKFAKPYLMKIMNPQTTPTVAMTEIMISIHGASSTVQGTFFDLEYSQRNPMRLRWHMTLGDL